ncbi:MAG: hypothetical protein AAFR65_03740 [Pseudomonadota bacterium]
MMTSTALAAPVAADVIPAGAIDVTDVFFDDTDPDDGSALLEGFEAGLITTTSVQNSAFPGFDLFEGDGEIGVPETTQENEAFFLPDAGGPMISVSEIEGASAAARAATGDIGVFASAEGSSSLFESSSATAQSSFFDFITASSASASGDAELQLQFTLDGSLAIIDTTSLIPSASVAIAAGTTSDVAVTSDFDEFDADGAEKSTFETQLEDFESEELFGAALIHNISNFDEDTGTFLDDLFVIEDTLTFNIPVVLGEEQGIFTALIATAVAGGEVDFFGSLSLSSVVLSQNGEEISDGVVMGQVSGTLLDLSGDPIPLPGALWLFGTAVALILGKRRSTAKA